MGNALFFCAKAPRATKNLVFLTRFGTGPRRGRDSWAGGLQMADEEGTMTTTVAGDAVVQGQHNVAQEGVLVAYVPADASRDLLRRLTRRGDHNAIALFFEERRGEE
ncbi:MAG: hypothetical protein US42_C0007G0033 [Candidatus Magasanikbacteria bacterium GW2011_GWC2_37_14]|uniref:Uncharacterized protein n=1 Tax=Candidatus Magasanikbacteria bacterium GW2011_GWC2_37_14 TaxID=1619046 RepID=A0A0G0GCG0_9BACT|nr:MAG: hypothetical protein US42_C0007G0033 [Candidatus Magasanikbacteria bacterium GW2011_GWC2_37_14]